MTHFFTDKLTGLNMQEIIIDISLKATEMIAILSTSIGYKRI